MKIFFSIIFLLALYLTASAADNQLASIELKFINADEVVSVIKTLVDENTKLSIKDNHLLISGDPAKVKSISEIVKQIDKPPAALTIEFVASSHKLDFAKKEKTYRAGSSNHNVSQSMSITERQWVRLNTGLSIPISERSRNPDGTESLSFHYQKVSKSYIFKVHEFSGWSVIQVGMNTSSLDDSIAGAIKNTALDTTIVGKTGEWLEVASSKKIHSDKNTKHYSTQTDDDNYIHLYVRVIANTNTETGSDKGKEKENK